MFWAAIGQQAGNNAKSILGGYAQIRQAERDYRLAKSNARFMRMSADYDIFAGKLAQMEVHRKAGEVLNEQKSSFASQGVDLASETVSQVREETLANARDAANEVELQAAMAAWGKRTQAKLDMKKARNDRTSARISGYGQIASGAFGFG